MLGAYGILMRRIAKRGARTATRPMPGRTGAAALCIAAAWCAPVAAQEDMGFGGFVFVGPGITADYEGSDDYEVIPGFVGYAQYGDRSVLIAGTDIDADIVPGARFSIGPSFTYRGAREDVEDRRVDLLDDVDAAVEIGANFGVNYGELLTEGDGFSAGLRIVQDVADGHGGLVGRASANYGYPVTERLRVTGGIELTAVSDDYADAYFDIGTAEAARSGLSAFDAEGGFKDVKFTIMADYALSETWGVGAYVSHARLFDDFADSPVTDEAGSDSQFFGLVGVQYRF